MFKDAQKRVDEWAQQFETPYWSPLSQLARATEEMGELARLLNHIYGDKPKKQEEARQELEGEIADVIFTMICLANAHDIDLDDAFSKTMEKCYGRDNKRFDTKR